MECIYVPRNKLLTIKIADEIDESTTDKLRRKIDNEITRFMPRKVIFDFSNVAFMDSAGIGMVIGRYKQACIIGGRTYLANLTDGVRKIFLMSGVLKIIPEIDIEKRLKDVVSIEDKEEVIIL